MKEFKRENFRIIKLPNRKGFSVRVDFSKVNEEQLEALVELFKTIEIEKFEITGLKGLTIKKLERFGRQNFYLAEDSLQCMSIEEIRKILEILKNMEVEEKNTIELDKFLTVYIRLLLCFNYDITGITGNDKTAFLARGIVGPLLYGKGICTGFAKTLKFVCEYIGIESIIVGGNSLDEDGNCGGGHTWNQIKIDGKWYNVDITWDKHYFDERIKLQYCLRGDEQFLKSHKAEKDSNVHTCYEDYNQEEIFKRMRPLYNKNSESALENLLTNERTQKNENDDLER